MTTNRQLAAIMFTDIVGYTALMGSDEAKALSVLKINRNFHKSVIKKYGGKWLKEMGDGTLASFKTISDAVYCAGELIKSCKEKEIQLRIAIHQGEIVEEQGDIFGDGVNVASRLETLAHPDEILVSGPIHRNIKNKPGISSTYLGEKELKNVDEPIKVYSIKVEESPTSLEKSKRITNRKPIYIAIGQVLIILILYNLYSHINIETTGDSESNDVSIAVLPFINDSPDEDIVYICNGMMEEIINDLQKIGELGVTARTSVERYRNADRNIKTIGEELGVVYLVEGSVRKSGDDLRITVQLINANTGNHLWSEIYDGKYTEKIFEFESDIAKQVVSSLAVVITPEEEQRIERKPSTDINAWGLLEKGMDEIGKFARTRQLEYLEYARDYFNEALEIDPEYARAFSSIAFSYNFEENLDSALYFCNKALSIDPEAAAAHLIIGNIYSRIGKNDLAFKHLSSAYELTPSNNWANYSLGEIYFYVKKDIERGLPLMTRGLRYGGAGHQYLYESIGGALSNVGYYEKSEKYFCNLLTEQFGCLGLIGLLNDFLAQGKIEEMTGILDNTCMTQVCEFECYRSRFIISLLNKEVEETKPYFDQYIELIKEGARPLEWDSLYFAYMYKKIGDDDRYNNMLKKLTNVEMPQSSRDYHFIAAGLYAMVGKNDQAIENLSRILEVYFIHELVEYLPMFDNIRNDPDFQALMLRAEEERASARKKIIEMEEKGELEL